MGAFGITSYATLTDQAGDRPTPTANRSPSCLREERARDIAWAGIRADVLARDITCRAVDLIPSVRCVGPLDPHHIRRRGQGGPDSLDNLVSLCRAHHDWTHQNPASAREIGLLR